MKEKVKWARTQVNSTYKDAWLAGFDFAKEKCAEGVCGCCDNPGFCRDLGEKDPEADKKRAKKIIPVPPTGFGFETLE